MSTHYTHRKNKIVIKGYIQSLQYHKETLFEQIYEYSKFNAFLFENDCQFSLMNFLMSDIWSYPNEDYPWPVRQLLFRNNSKFKSKPVSFKC